MTKVKFTQEEFSQIVQIQEDKFFHSIAYRGADGEELTDVARKFIDNIKDGHSMTKGEEKFIALINPVSRDLVKDSLVEADSLFLWSYNAPNGVKYNLNTLAVDEQSAADLTERIFFDEDDATPITFSEVKKQMGDLFNIDLFDRIEVSKKPNKGEEGF